MVKALAVVKRDGTAEEFSSAKLAASLHRALLAGQVRRADIKMADTLAERIHIQVMRAFTVLTPRTQDIQDIAVGVLENAGHSRAVVAYLKSRQQRTQQQRLKTLLGIRDDIGLSQETVAALIDQFLMRGDEGRVSETPAQLCRRVAKAVAAGARAFESASTVKKFEEEYYRLLSERSFLPANPILMNAGATNVLLCNVMLPVPDNIKGIFSTLAAAVDVARQGTSVSLWLGDLRPRGAAVKSTHGHTTGPCSFLQLFDHALDIIREGSRHKAMNVAVLPVDHPDLEEFIALSTLKNFRRSVIVTDRFMKAASENKVWTLGARTVNASQLLDSIVKAMRGDALTLAFTDGPACVGVGVEPGQLLHPYESVPQGVINLAAMVDRGHIAWEKLRQAVSGGVRFLDDSIEASVYPLPDVEQATKAHRHIGLGIMGFADMLIQLKIVYGSAQSIATADKIMKVVHDEARKASAALAKKRSPQNKTLMRNASLITISPMGALAKVAGVNAGIEPSVTPVIRSALNTLSVNPSFEGLMREKKAYSPALMCKIAKVGVDVPDVPRDIRKLFVGAVSSDVHLKVQMAFQKYADNGVGKMIPLPAALTDADARKIVLAAHKMRQKSVWLTVLP